MPKTCFVIMGYHNKQIPNKNITIDLDVTYRDIIKPVLIENDYVSIENIINKDAFRADEYVSSNGITESLVESIIKADLAIVDVSCYNNNAIYELGVRHALKKYSTIILCDKETCDDNIFFDIKNCHVIIYTHSGKYIDQDEINQAKRRLNKKIKHIESRIKTNTIVPDSPIIKAKDMLQNQIDLCDNKKDNLRSLSLKAETCFKNCEYVKAEKLYKKSIKLEKDDILVAHCAMCMHNQQTVKKIKEACLFVESNMNINATTNPECQGIYATICKKLWNITKDERYLNKAEIFYAKGYYSGDSLYCGRNLLVILLTKATLTNDIDTRLQIVCLVKYLAQIMLATTNQRLKSTNESSAWDIGNKRDFESILRLNVKQKQFTILASKHEIEAINKGYKELRSLLKKLGMHD